MAGSGSQETNRKLNEVAAMPGMNIRKTRALVHHIARHPALEQFVRETEVAGAGASSETDSVVFEHEVLQEDEAASPGAESGALSEADADLPSHIDAYHGMDSLSLPPTAAATVVAAAANASQEGAGRAGRSGFGLDPSASSSLMLLADASNHAPPPPQPAAPLPPAPRTPHHAPLISGFRPEPASPAPQAGLAPQSLLPGSSGSRSPSPPLAKRQRVNPVDDDPRDTIALRTRARVSLEDVNLTPLDPTSIFQSAPPRLLPTGAAILMKGGPEAVKEHSDYLALIDALTNGKELSDDENDSDEYNFLEEQRRKRPRSPESSIAETLSPAQAGSVPVGAEDSDAEDQHYEHSYVPISVKEWESLLTDEDLQPLVNILRIAGPPTAATPEPVMTPGQRLVFQHQVRQHVQLLVQTHALSMPGAAMPAKPATPCSLHTRITALLQRWADRCAAEPTSALAQQPIVQGLPAYLTWSAHRRRDFADDTAQQRKTGRGYGPLGMQQSSKGDPLAAESPAGLDGSLRFLRRAMRHLPKDELQPELTLTPTDVKLKLRTYFSPAEYDLLLLGLRRFGQNIPAIQKTYLPGKEEKQLRSAVRNRTASVRRGSATPVQQEIVRLFTELQRKPVGYIPDAMPDLPIPDAASTAPAPVASAGAINNSLPDAVPAAASLPAAPAARTAATAAAAAAAAAPASISSMLPPVSQPALAPRAPVHSYLDISLPPPDAIAPLAAPVSPGTPVLTSDAATVPLTDDRPLEAPADEPSLSELFCSDIRADGAAGSSGVAGAPASEAVAPSLSEALRRALSPDASFAAMMSSPISASLIASPPSSRVVVLETDEQLDDDDAAFSDDVSSMQQQKQPSHRPMSRRPGSGCAVRLADRFADLDRANAACATASVTASVTTVSSSTPTALATGVPASSAPCAASSASDAAPDTAAVPRRVWSKTMDRVLLKAERRSGAVESTWTLVLWQQPDMFAGYQCEDLAARSRLLNKLLQQKRSSSR